MIITNPSKLNFACKKVSVEEGEIIAEKLFNVLGKYETAVGLAANQIGVDARVCVVNVIEPLYFINPEIVEPEGEFIYGESCLSFPGKTVKTRRYTDIVVNADNIEGAYYFSTRADSVGKIDNKKVMECIAVQHEIAHTQGLTMFDFEHKLAPITVNNHIGRNEKVKVKNNITGEIKVLKYKKVMNELGDDKKWIILN